MQTRDRIISLLVVAGLIALIWWGGARLRREPADAGAPIASASAMPSASTSSAPDAVDAALASVVDSGIDAGMSGACRALNDATAKRLDDAKKSRACTPDFDMTNLGCETSPNGATWGLRVDDVVDLANTPTNGCATGWLVRLVHVDVNGAEAAIVPGIAATQRAHTFDVTEGTKIADVTFYDWDGDGDDEVLVRGVRGASDHPDEQRAVVWRFLAGRIVPYEPAAGLTIVGSRDVDADGRPDLLVTFFGVGKDAPPVSHVFVAHSLSGAFSLRDATAVTWAEKACPHDPQLELSTKAPADFDAMLADEMACTLLWGHEPKELGPALAKACRLTFDDAAATCPAWAKRMVQTKPPLSLR